MKIEKITKKKLIYNLITLTKTISRKELAGVIVLHYVANRPDGIGVGIGPSRVALEVK